MSGELPQIQQIEKKFEKSEKKGQIEDFRPGDTVRVHYEIVEGDKKRIQIFQGVVIRIKNRKKSGIRTSFTVRKISHLVGVERTFPYNSPLLKKVEVVTRGKVRKSKLYYMRKLSGKSARIQERIEGALQEQPIEEAPDQIDSNDKE